ncbi:MAG TPA: peptidylprolyl isomerase [Candidatus Brocadiaceae bacterium]|nr:peptidylprolyl isomerase [Candidatus Brocadiaceae bacterium]
MLKGFIKPVGFVLSGILCVQLSVFAEDAGTKKPKKSKSAPKTEAQTDVKAEAKPEAKPPAAAEANPEAKAETMPAAEAKKAEGDGKVVATVNGENIYQNEVDKVLHRFGPQVPQEQIPTATKQILDGLITQKLILQFVRDSKIQVDAAAIEVELNKVREDIKSNPGLAGQTLEQVLEKHGGSIDDMKKDITMFLSMEKYLSKDVDDTKIKAYFEQHKSVYAETEVKASHILVDTRKLKTDAELAQAMEKIKKAKAEITGGKDFAEAAKEYSDCPSSKEGGDLGYFKREGQMVEPFAAAAFALKKGDVSDVVKTDFGYHIIKATDIKTPTFDEVKETVKQNMIEEKGQLLVKELKEKAKIDIKAGA